jgi:hypothetical protein
MAIYIAIQTETKGKKLRQLDTERKGRKRGTRGSLTQRDPARPHHGLHIDVGALVDEQLHRRLVPVR